MASFAQNSTPSTTGRGPARGGSFLSVLRRRLPVIIVTTVLVTGAAGAFAYLSGTRYQSTVELLFNQTLPTELNALGLLPPSPNADRLSADYNAFVASRRVAVLAAHKLGDGTSADTVQSDVAVPPSKSSDVVDATATGSSAQRAAKLANVYAAAAIQLARGDQVARTRQIVAGLTAQLNRFSRQDFTCGPWSSPSTNARISGCEGATQQVVSGIKNQIAKVSALGNSGQAIPQLIQPGYVPTHPSSKPLQTILLGALFGLILGVGLALLREQTDARLRQAGAVSAAFDAPVLATVPNSRSLSRHAPFASLPSQVTAPFYMVLGHLRYGEKPSRSVLVTSARVGQGKTTIAWNLACAAAASGMSVILVDADLRRSNLATQYRLPHTPGLSEVLQGEVLAADAVQRIPVSKEAATNGHVRRLSVLPSGSPPPEPVMLLQSGQMTELLGALRHYELVIVDASPLIQQSDAISLLHRVDGVLIAAPLNSTRGAEAEQLRTQLAALEARVVGVIATGGGKQPGGYVTAGSPAAVYS